MSTTVSVEGGGEGGGGEGDGGGGEGGGGDGDGGDGVSGEGMSPEPEPASSEPEPEPPSPEPEPEPSSPEPESEGGGDGDGGGGGGGGEGGTGGGGDGGGDNEVGGGAGGGETRHFSQLTWHALSHGPLLHLTTLSSSVPTPADVLQTSLSSDLGNADATSTALGITVEETPSITVESTIASVSFSDFNVPLIAGIAVSALVFVVVSAGACVVVHRRRRKVRVSVHVAAEHNLGGQRRGALVPSYLQSLFV